MSQEKNVNAVLETYAVFHVKAALSISCSVVSEEAFFKSVDPLSGLHNFVGHLMKDTCQSYLKFPYNVP